MKHQLIFSFLLLIMLSVLFSDCSVQKRKYRSGFYVSTRKNHPPKNESNTVLPLAASQKICYQQTQREDTKVSAQQEKGLLASVQHTDRKHKQKWSIQPLPLAEDSCGDRIIFTDGEEVFCRVIEVGIANVLYKACDHLDGPMISRSKNNIFMISYKNGSKEVFKHKQKVPPAAKQSPQIGVKKKKLNGISLAAFIISLFSWTLVLAPVALVMGITGRNQIKKNPETFKGDEFASIAIAISSVVLFLVLLAIVSFLFL